MAGRFLTLLDDIATVLDDVAVMTKLAAKKTAGVLGDDLALNAEQVTGVNADRELPVVWAVAKGSFVNKAILVPSGLLISAVAPWLVLPLLMVGGVYLCFEGFEKVVHKLLPGGEDSAHQEAVIALRADPELDLVALERGKIKGAIRTDFVLSAEIIVISLGVVADAPFLNQLLTLATIGITFTIGVYGLVAAIVKLDDGGRLLLRATGEGIWARARRALGAGILGAAPWLMKGLGIVGTVAMFLVGGGIVVHGIPQVHHLAEGIAARGGIVGSLGPTGLNLGVGVAMGAVALGVVSAAQRIFRRAAV